MDAHGNGNGPVVNGHHGPRPKAPLSWLDLRVFYVRISKCDINDASTPEHLTLNHVPLNRDTLLELNGVRTGIRSDGVSTLLRRDRVDRKSEEVTFVSTVSFRTTGGVKFEVFDNDVLVVYGVLDLCDGNGVNGESSDHGWGWRMECESDVVFGNGFLKGRHKPGVELEFPVIEVCLAGSFNGSPLILTRSLQVSCRKRHVRKGTLKSIPENEATGKGEEGSSGLTLKAPDYSYYKPAHEYEHEHEYHRNPYYGMEYTEGEDGELSWFNAGVRVGVGIGLSVCLGIGIGVGLLARTYHGTARNFRRRRLL